MNIVYIYIYIVLFLCLVDVFPYRCPKRGTFQVIGTVMEKVFSAHRKVVFNIMWLEEVGLFTWTSHLKWIFEEQ